ncbi:hypothetical protein HRbin04_00487 [archaeon HR04]|nr:hypothetical protein HRbin04_00487 [archaeon HR04]
MEIEEYEHKVIEKDGEYVCCLCGMVFERGEVHGEWLASNDRCEPQARNVVSYIRTMSEEQREIRAILKSMRGNRLGRDNSRYLAELLHKKRYYRCINLNHIVPEHVRKELTTLYMRAVGAKIIKGTTLYILITEAMPWLSDEDKQRIKLGVLSYTNRKNGQISNKYGVKTARIFKLNDEQIREASKKGIYLTLWRQGRKIPLGQIMQFNRVIDLLNWLVHRQSQMK